MLRKAPILIAAALALFSLTACYSRTENPSTVQQTQDGGYILAGYAEYEQEGRSREVLLIKTDARGEKEWSRVYPDHAVFGSVQETKDGGYIITGIRLGDRKIAGLVKVDAQGKEEWFHYGDRRLVIDRVLEAQDGGYVLVGRTKRSHWEKGVWLTKLNAQGTEEWSQVLGNREVDSICSVGQVEGGGMVLAGSAADKIVGAWLVKTDALGDEEWSKGWPREGYRQYSITSMHPTDGGYILAGTSGDRAWLAKISTLGLVEWSRELPRGYFINSMRTTNDGGYILAGSSNRYDWLAKVDALGETEWSQSGNNRVWFSSINTIWPAQDGGYLLFGDVDNNQNAGWIAKVNALGSLEWDRIYGGLSRLQVTPTGDGGFVLISGFHGLPSMVAGKLIKLDAQGSEEWVQTFVKTSDSSFTLYLVMLLALLSLNLTVFSVYIRDMAARKESRVGWFSKFLLLGPLAVTWYKAYRKPKETEVVRGSKFYLLTKGIFLPWNLYALLVPGIFYWVVMIFDSTVNMQHVPAAVDWMGLFYRSFVFKPWLLSLIIFGAALFFYSTFREGWGDFKGSVCREEKACIEGSPSWLWQFWFYSL